MHRAPRWSQDTSVRKAPPSLSPDSVSRLRSLAYGGEREMRSGVTEWVLCAGWGRRAFASQLFSPTPRTTRPARRTTDQVYASLYPPTGHGRRQQKCQSASRSRAVELAAPVVTVQSKWDAVAGWCASRLGRTDYDRSRARDSRRSNYRD